jgi:hypothetical protein
MSGRLSSLPDMRQQCSGRVNGAVALRSVFPIATKPFPLHAACNRWPETIPEIDNRTASRTTMRRTVTCTGVPILSSLNRIVPRCACSIPVPLKPRRRISFTRPQATLDRYSRN